MVGGDNTIEAHARGPAGISITAKSSSVTSDDTGPILTFIVPVSSFKTGIGLRDEHMLKILESDVYSDVKLVIRDSDILRPCTDESTKGTTQGELTFHGVTKNVSVDYIAAADCEGHVATKAKFSINLTDYGVTPPSYLGINVKPTIDLIANFRFDTI